METYTRSPQSQQIPQAEKFKIPETIRTSLQTGEWVTSIDFKDAEFHIPIQNQSRNYHVHEFSCTGQNIPVQSTTIWSVHSSIGVHCSDQRGQTDGLDGYKNPPDEWLVRARSHQIGLQYTQTLVALCQDLGWLVNVEKSELDTKQVFDFVGYQFDLKEIKVRPTLDWWRTLTTKIRELLAGPTCRLRQLVSLIGMLTTTEKNRFQWHLKQNWRVPESLEKVIPVPRSLHPHLNWWLEESNGQPRSTITPTKTCSAIVYRCIKRRKWRLLKRPHCKGNLVPAIPESKLHINYLELKAVLALKEFRNLCQNNIIIATDNTTVVAYIYNEGGDEVGPSVCRSVENPDLVYQQTGYSQSPTHSRLGECGSRQPIQARPDNSN